MEYHNMLPGVFHKRPNRFIAQVCVGGTMEVCHVKNTGRCRELLVEGARVWCQPSDDPRRKTKFDLIAVEKGDRLINMDSQAPNAAAGEWLASGGLGEVQRLRREQVWGDSRFDFSFERDGRLCFLEVKGVTLEHDGHSAFPDAPTQRGVKHIRGLMEAVRQGFGGYILFVIQMEDVLDLEPNWVTDPAFAQALTEAQAAGVEILAMDCRVTPQTMELRSAVKVILAQNKNARR